MVLITVVSLIHFRYEAKEYHEERLSRKENAIKEHIEYILQTTQYPLKTANIPTIFKTRIMHGMLGACVFSKVFGTLFPGEGTIYLSQSVNFLKPMYVDVIYEAHFEVMEILEKNRARISTTILTNEGKKVVVGEAVVMNIEKIDV